MKLKKITAYIQLDHIKKDKIRMFLPSGFRGGYIMVEEDYAFHLGACYLPFNLSKKFLNAKKKVK